MAPFYFHTDSIEFSSSPHSYQHLIFFDFLVMAVPVDLKWYLTISQFALALGANDVGCGFLCLFIVCISSLEKYLFSSSVFLIMQFGGVLY
jgi:hypothetical protein